MISNSEVSRFQILRIARVLGLVVLVGLVGLGFTQMNQRVRNDQLKKATTADLLKEAQQNPNDIPLLYQLAYKQYRFGENKEAVETMRRIVQLEPNSARAWYGLARTAGGAGRAGEAVEAYRKVVELDPKQVMARLSLAEIYASAGLVTDAVREYDTANNRAEAARFGGGVFSKCLMEKGRLEEAWEILKASIEISPAQEKAFLQVAELGIRMKRCPEAEMLIQRRIGMSAQYDIPDVRHAMARVLLAQPDTPQSLETAEVMLRLFLERIEANGETNMLYGRALLARGNVKGAQDALEAGLKASPEHRESLTVLAEVYDRLHQPQRAAQMRARLAALEKKDGELPALRKAVEAAPDSTEARLRLAAALEKAGLFGEATEACEAILAKNPSDTNVSTLRDTYRQKALDKLTKSGEFKASTVNTMSEMAP